MEEFIILANKTLSAQEENLYSNSKGAIVKTILLHNSNSEEKEVTLKLDSVTFLFTLNSKETKILSTPIVTNSIVAKGSAINIHISGIQL